jgi:hypothetical protein
MAATQGQIPLDSVKELKSATVTVTLRNQDHQPIPGSGLQTLRLTLFDEKTGALINRPFQQDILGLDPTRVNGGTIDETGELSLWLEPEDNPILGSNKNPETHILFLEWSWLDSGTKYGGVELRLPVENFIKLPVV